ncbi:hypothetical protein R3P38DRAFT_2518318, partial [Favolaschia claudopus]
IQPLFLPMSPSSHHLEEILASSLLDPMNPASLCGVGIFGALSQVIVLGKTVPYQVAFLQAAMKYMTKPRSATEHELLRNRLCHCHCDFGLEHVQNIHGFSPPTVTKLDLLDLAIHLMCKSITSAIEQYDPTLEDARKRWPRSREQDTNPFNLTPSALCDALLQWTLQPQYGSGAFSLIGSIAMFSPRFHIHVLATPRVFQLATAQLLYTVRNFPTNPEQWNVRFDSRVLACASDLFSRFTHHQTNIARLILSDEFGIRADMLVVARDMQALLPAEDSRASMASAVEWFRTVRFLDGGKRFTPRGGRGTLQAGPQGYFHVAFKVIATLRSSKCAMNGCDGRGATAHSRLCSGCQVARYCCNEHQNQSWRGTRHPHKPLCDAIQALRQAIGMGDENGWKALIHATGRAPEKFIEICHGKGVPPMLGKAILEVGGWLPADF